MRENYREIQDFNIKNVIKREIERLEKKEREKERESETERERREIKKSLLQWPSLGVISRLNHKEGRKA